MSTTPPVRDAVAPRYTTLDNVKLVMGVTTTTVAKDERITDCIIAAESTLDLHMHRSMPDTDDVEGPQPPTLIVPSAWEVTATQVAVGIYKAAEAPSGTLGSDDFMGSISVTGIVSEAVRRNPAMFGWMVGFGVA